VWGPAGVVGPLLNREEGCIMFDELIEKMKQEKDRLAYRAV